MKYFYIIKEKIAYMECVIQSNMFYSFYLLLSILPCNVDSALVSDSNAYIWFSNCIQMFKCLQLLSSDNNDMFCYLNILSFLCCWYLIEKNIYIKRKEIALLLLLSFLNPKISFFIGKGGRSVCAERAVTQEGSCEKILQSVMVECRWIKKAILAWRNYLIAPKDFDNIWFF